VHSDRGKGQPIFTAKRPLRHVARFVLIGIYTGTRASAIATASPYQEQGRSFVDLERGIFYRKQIGKRATKKRQTPAPVPSRLLAHMRRWARLKLIAIASSSSMANRSPQSRRASRARWGLLACGAR
jgi:hypothetical protein